MGDSKERHSRLWGEQRSTPHAARRTSSHFIAPHQTALLSRHRYDRIIFWPRISKFKSRELPDAIDGDSRVAIERCLLFIMHGDFRCPERIVGEWLGKSRIVVEAADPYRYYSYYR